MMPVFSGSPRSTDIPVCRRRLAGHGSCQNRVALILLAVAWLALPGAGWCQETALEAVRFLPQWLPQAQFAGYYMAQDQGFFRNEGLVVEILRGGTHRSPSELLARGETDFATMMLATGIVQRAGGAPLRHLAQVMQRSALMLVARRAGGITTPADLTGKRVGLWGGDFRAPLLAFLQAQGLKVTIIPQHDTMNLFLRGAVEAASAMWYNEYHLLLAAGMNPEELTTFLLADYGFNFPEDGIYCREELARSRPDLCRRFVRASLKGWEYAFAHPEEALDIVMTQVEEAQCATNRTHQRWMLARLQDLMVPPGATRPTGRLQEGDYLRVATELQKYNLIPHIPRFGDFILPGSEDR